MAVPEYPAAAGGFKGMLEPGGAGEAKRGSPNAEAQPIGGRTPAGSTKGPLPARKPSRSDLAVVRVIQPPPYRASLVANLRELRYPGR